MEQNQPMAVSQSTALHLCFWLGIYGAHDFFAGNKSRGVLKLILSFIFPIVPFIIMLRDLYAIIKGTYVAGDNRRLTLNAGNLSKKIYGIYWPAIGCIMVLAIIFAIVVPKFTA